MYKCDLKKKQDYRSVTAKPIQHKLIEKPAGGLKTHIPKWWYWEWPSVHQLISLVRALTCCSCASGFLRKVSRILAELSHGATLDTSFGSNAHRRVSTGWLNHWRRCYVLITHNTEAVFASNLFLQYVCFFQERFFPSLPISYSTFCIMRSL